MNLLFQSAIANALRRQCDDAPDVQLDTQDSGLYLATFSPDGRNAFPLRPDIVIRRGDAVVAVLDTKWKKLAGRPQDRESGVAPADAYQMHAYAAAYECPEVTLLYPWHQGLRGSGEPSYLLPTIGTVTPCLRLRFVDVRQSPLTLFANDGLSHDPVLRR